MILRWHFPGEREMIRLFIAAVLLTAAAAPAFACDYNSASTDPQSNTVASQPSSGQSTPAPASNSGQKSS
jgi:hypothetical protein